MPNTEARGISASPTRLEPMASIVRGSDGRGRNVLVVVGLLVFATIAGRRLGSDANWDLYGYHAYIGESALARRWRIDVVPAAHGSFHNPLFDLPLAFALRSSVRTMTVWLTVVQWLCWCAVWWLIRELFREHTFRVQLLALGFAMGGAGATSLAFTSFQDWTVAAFLACGLAAVTKANSPGFPDDRLVKRWIAIAGSFAALAIAVKLTAAPFSVALLVAAVTMSRRRLAPFLRGAAITFSLTSLPWWIFVAVRFGNPVFPYFNSVFRSPSAPLRPWDDSRFGARSLQDLIRVPTDLARGTTRYSEYLYRDLRPLAAVVSAVVWSLLRLELAGPRALWRHMAIFGIVSYVAWITMFGIYRYALILELLAALFVVAVMAHLPVRASVIALAIPLLLVSTFTSAPNWGRNTPMRVRVPLSPGDRVLLADLGPSSYLANSVGTGTAMASIQGFAYGFFKYDSPLGDELRDFVQIGLASETLVVIVNPANPVPSDLELLGIDLPVERCTGFRGAVAPLLSCRGQVATAPG